MYARLLSYRCHRGRTAGRRVRGSFQVPYNIYKSLWCAKLSDSWTILKPQRKLWGEKDWAFQHGPILLNKAHLLVPGLKNLNTFLYLNWHFVCHCKHFCSTLFTKTLGGYFTWMTIYAVNQTMIQRYLTVKDLRLLLTHFHKLRASNKIFSVFNQDCQDLHLAQRSCHHCDPLHRCLCRAHHLHKVQKSCQVGIYSMARMCRMPNFFYP